MLLYLALMLALIFAGADLALLIAASGAIPLFSGLLCAVAARGHDSLRLGGGARAGSG